MLQNYNYRRKEYFRAKTKKTKMHPAENLLVKSSPAGLEFLVKAVVSQAPDLFNMLLRSGKSEVRYL